MGMGMDKGKGKEMNYARLYFIKTTSSRMWLYASASSRQFITSNLHRNGSGGVEVEGR
jgi:hypothetical protein